MNKSVVDINGATQKEKEMSISHTAPFALSSSPFPLADHAREQKERREREEREREREEFGYNFPEREEPTVV